MCPLSPEPPYQFPPHPITPGCHRAPNLDSLCHTSNSYWLSILHIIMHMFQCYFIFLIFVILNYFLDIVKDLLLFAVSFTIYYFLVLLNFLFFCILFFCIISLVLFHNSFPVISSIYY